MGATWDVVIVGAGPAGLSAALWLARCRRCVLTVHDGRPRNVRATAIHGYLGLDGVAPRELLRRAALEVRSAGGRIRRARVRTVTRIARGGFRIRMRRDSSTVTERARAVLVATGIQDHVPSWAKAEYGRRVHHCGDCDGPEYRGGVLAVVGSGRGLVPYARRLSTWARRVIVVSQHAGASSAVGPRVTWLKGEVRSCVRSRDGRLRLQVGDGGDVACDAAFVMTRRHTRLEPYATLGLRTQAGGLVRVDARHRTNVEGAYAAGDVTHGSQLAIVAAAEGAMAAIHIHSWLADRPRT